MTRILASKPTEPTTLDPGLLVPQRPILPMLRDCSLRRTGISKHNAPGGNHGPNQLEGRGLK
jgi:hypothetical protein